VGDVDDVATVRVWMAGGDEDVLRAPDHLPCSLDMKCRVVFGTWVVDLAGALVDLLVARLRFEQRRDDLAVGVQHP
jgi:hypothetical protein